MYLLSSFRLISLQSQLGNELTNFMEIIRTSLLQYRKHLDKTLQMLRESNARFIKSFKYVPKVYCILFIVPVHLPANSICLPFKVLTFFCELIKIMKIFLHFVIVFNLHILFLKEIWGFSLPLLSVYIIGDYVHLSISLLNIGCSRMGATSVQRRLTCTVRNSKTCHQRLMYPREPLCPTWKTLRRSALIKPQKSPLSLRTGMRNATSNSSHSFDQIVHV